MHTHPPDRLLHTCPLDGHFYTHTTYLLNRTLHMHPPRLLHKHLLGRFLHMPSRAFAQVLPFTNISNPLG